MLKHAKNTSWFIRHETPHDDASSSPPDSFFFFMRTFFHNIFATWVFFFSHCCNRAEPPRQPRARPNFQLLSSRACNLATNGPPPSHFWRNQKVNAARCLSNPKEINPEDTVIPPNAGNINAYVVSGRRTSDSMLQTFCRALRLRSTCAAHAVHTIDSSVSSTAAFYLPSTNFPITLPQMDMWDKSKRV